MASEKTSLLKKQENEDSTSAKSSIRQFTRSLNELVSGPRDLWMIFGILLLHGYLYYSIVIILPLFLSNEFGYSDTMAGLIYGGMGASYTLFAIFLGTTIDRMGIRKIEIFSSAALCIGTVCLAFAYNTALLLISILILLPLGGSVGVPAGKIAIRRFTKPQARSVAFSIVFMVMNIAAMMGFSSDDIFTHNISSNHFSAFRLIILAAGVVMLISVVVSFFIREMDYEQSGEEEIAAPGGQYSSWQIIKDLLVTPGFWRYVLLVCMAIGIRIVYRSLDATLPKYMERTLGEGAYYGTILMLNPLTILICTPIFTPLVYYLSNYALIVVGGTISSLSCLIMILEPSYYSCAAFSIVLGIGESIWTPRFYEYSIDVAPKGKEGTYMALTSAPLFFAAMAAGTLSGTLLEGYCPENGNTGDCWAVWLIITGIAITSPILLFACRSCIDQPKYEDQQIESKI